MSAAQNPATRTAQPLARRRLIRAVAGCVEEPRLFARLVAFDSLAASAPHWLALQAAAPASPYQTLAWTEAWLLTEGAASGVRPFICIALDERDAPVALLPFGVTRRGAVTAAGFLGGRHANYNLGLFDPAVAWTADEVARLMARAAAACPVRLDLFTLVHQPLAWGDWSNPLALLPRQPSPSQAHRAALLPDGEAFLRQHQSAAARKKLRNKTKQMDALGPVRHVVARMPDEVEAVLDAYLAQKAAKLASIGVIGRGDPDAARDLLARAAATSTLELHALFCGARIVATFGGLAHAGRFSGLMISHDADPDFARVSPGEQLLTLVIEAKCREGFTSFDLGIGEARYKQSLCPIADPLFDSLVPVTARGRLAVAGGLLRLRVKRQVKQSRWAWPLVQKLRKRLAGRTPD